MEQTSCNSQVWRFLLFSKILIYPMVINFCVSSTQGTSFNRTSWFLFSVIYYSNRDTYFRREPSQSPPVSIVYSTQPVNSGPFQFVQQLTLPPVGQSRVFNPPGVGAPTVLTTSTLPAVIVSNNGSFSVILSFAHFSSFFSSFSNHNTISAHFFRNNEP